MLPLKNLFSSESIGFKINTSILYLFRAWNNPNQFVSFASNFTFNLKYSKNQVVQQLQVKNFLKFNFGKILES